MYTFFSSTSASYVPGCNEPTSPTLVVSPSLDHPDLASVPMSLSASTGNVAVLSMQSQDDESKYCMYVMCEEHSSLTFKYTD